MFRCRATRRTYIIYGFLLYPTYDGHAIVSERKAILIVARVQRGTYNTGMNSGGYFIIIHVNMQCPAYSKTSRVWVGGRFVIRLSWTTIIKTYSGTYFYIFYNSLYILIFRYRILNVMMFQWPLSGELRVEANVNNNALAGSSIWHLPPPVYKIR